MAKAVKVLCLCGYTQSASIFKGRLAAVRKACPSNVTFKLLEPPHIVQAVNLPDGSLVEYDSNAGGGNEDERPRAWWFAKDVEGQPGLKRYEGLEETWKLLKQTLEEEKYDVVLGFSQGAALAGALASQLCLSPSPINHPPFSLAILVSGFAMQDPNGSYFPSGAQRSHARTLHIIGRGDTIVSMERCQSLIDKFDDPLVEFHDGGHFVPSKANFRKYFKALFEAIAKEGTAEDIHTAIQSVQPPSLSSGTNTPVSGQATPTRPHSQL